MASHRRVCAPRPPDSPDLAIADLYLFGRLRKQLSRKTLDIEENVLKTITEILREAPSDEVKRALVHWREICQWVADHNGEFYPIWLNTKPF
jgi:hypothetical protein